MYHRRAPVASWKPITFGPYFRTTSTAKCSAGRCKIATWPTSPRQKNSIRPVFTWSPLDLCLFLLSLNYMNKKCDKNRYGLRVSTYLCTRLNNSIANSDIRIPNPLSATLLSVSHTELLNTVLVQTRWSVNCSICHNGSDYFPMAT